MGVLNADALAAFLVPENLVAPFEFRSLAGEDLEAMEALFEAQAAMQDGVRGAGKPVGDEASRNAREDRIAAAGLDRARRETMLRDAADRARQEGIEQGKREGRSAAQAELEANMRASVAQERARLVGVAKDFGTARERYFSVVEQEVVKLALAIAGRVLHRETQIDPLLLAGAVRVALEKMQDRSGVVLRVAGADVAAWELAFQATEPSERPQVVEDAKLERGECVLDTKMGTVELGVSVQLEEIEKGFFDLLNHRPVQ
jgi:flagellar assembly protein FliH